MKKASFKRLKTSSCSSLLLQADDHDSVADSYNYDSAELIGSNADLLTEILIRVPSAKSFYRFKSVSKRWQSLLTHPGFSTLRFDKLLISSGLYHHEYYVSFDVQNPTTPPFLGLDLSPDDHIDGIRIVQSCNGLLLCCGDKKDGCSGNYYVCNPTTKKVAISHEKNSLGLNVYEMLRDHSGWFIKYQLDLHQLSAAYPNMTYNFYEVCIDKYDFRVLDVVRDEEEEDTFMVVKVVDDIKRYNIRAKSFEQLCYIPDNIEDFKGYGTRTFFEIVMSKK